MQKIVSFGPKMVIFSSRHLQQLFTELSKFGNSSGTLDFSCTQKFLGGNKCLKGDKSLGLFLSVKKRSLSQSVIYSVSDKNPPKYFKISFFAKTKMLQRF